MKEIKNIWLTKRDKALLVWVNKMGFVTIALIANKWGVGLSTAYGRVKKLVEHEYLHHQRIYHELPGVYYVAKRGMELIGDDLPMVKSIPRGSYDHDLQVTKVMLALSRKYACDYMSERELRYLCGKQGVGKREHISDGELLLNDKRIAIEVELSKKGSARFQKIITSYLKNFEIHEVWYFCASNEIKNQVMRYQSSCGILRVFGLEEAFVE